MALVNIYEYILLFLATVFTYSLCGKYKVANFDLSFSSQRRNDTIGLALCIFFTFLIGLRPMGTDVRWMWADSAMYGFSYEQQEGVLFKFHWTTYEPIFENLFNFWASARLGISSLFLLCDAIYFGCTYLACRKWFPHDTTAAYLAFLGAFSTYSYSYNGVRAGVAGAVFLVGLAYYEKKWISILFVILSAGFHHSMQLPIMAYFLTLFYKNPKWYFYGWAFCVLMSVLHVSAFMNLFAGWSDEGGKGYLTATGDDESNFMTGFRPDFLLYSSMPVIVGYYVVMKNKLQVSKLYSALLHMYLCTNGIWMLCMYASYTNRIAYLSWFMYPFVLIYPFLKENLGGMRLLGTNNQYTMLSKVMGYHLAFTLFMELIFYKFIK